MDNEITPQELAVMDEQSKTDRQKVVDKNSYPSRTLNDIGNADRFTDRYPNKYIFIDGKRGQFWVYNGKQWTKDKNKQLYRDYEEMVKTMRKEKRNYPEGMSEEQSVKAVDKWHSFINSTGNAPRRRGAIDILKGRFAIDPEEFDSNILLINTPLGIINVSNLKQTKHDPRYKLTKITNGSLKPVDKPEHWLSFLDQTFKGYERPKDIEYFVQRLAGYSLLGTNPKRKMIVIHGEGETGNGSNGKSLLVETIGYVLNDYATTIRPQFLLKKRNQSADNATTSLLKMQGARFVYTSELNSNQQLDEALVKQITGDRKISGRANYGDETDIEKTFVIWLVTNRKPLISGTEDAIWSRIIDIPFKHTVPEKEQDVHLFDKFKQEKDGIMCWIIEGLQDYMVNGLAIPEEITNAADEYRKESDVVGNFTNDCIEFVSYETLRSQSLLNAYRDWAEENGCSMKDTTFIKRFSKRHEKNKFHDRNGNGYQGMKLK